jgi:hypothetical protein
MYLVSILDFLYKYIYFSGIVHNVLILFKSHLFHLNAKQRVKKLFTTR